MGYTFTKKFICCLPEILILLAILSLYLLNLAPICPEDSDAQGDRKALG